VRGPGHTVVRDGEHRFAARKVTVERGLDPELLEDLSRRCVEELLAGTGAA